MRKWRPEEWEKTKYGRDTSWIVGEHSDAFECGADAMLEAMSREIEKVENPYAGLDERLAFECARQKILSLQKE